MVTVAVSAFDDKIIRALHLLRIADDRAFLAADVAGKDDLRRLPILLRPDFYGRGA